ncbi:MAG TPA: transcription antitermination factor NusB [Spirochaetota bacterium]|nr:transcription antitermination factor NusB [Spirochaetota bacterium]
MPKKSIASRQSSNQRKHNTGKRVAVEVPALKTGKQNERRQGRILAFETLYAYQFHKDCSILDLFKSIYNNSGHTAKTKQFAKKIISGTVKNIKLIDNTIIPKLRNWEFSRIAATNKAILRIAIYELIYLQGIPAKVTIDEAIVLAKIYSDRDDYKFINAVLDKVKNENQTAK